MNLGGRRLDMVKNTVGQSDWCCQYQTYCAELGPVLWSAVTILRNYFTIYTGLRAKGEYNRSCRARIQLLVK